MYTISTTPGGRIDTAETIPDALAALATHSPSSCPTARSPGASPTPPAPSTAATST